MPKKPTTAGKKDARRTPPLSVRMPPAVQAALDVAAAQLAVERPDSNITRADAVRVLLVEALTARQIPIK
jgi:hypothetical protein